MSVRKTPAGRDVRIPNAPKSPARMHRLLGMNYKSWRGTFYPTFACVRVAPILCGAFRHSRDQQFLLSSARTHGLRCVASAGIKSICFCRQSEPVPDAHEASTRSRGSHRAPSFARIRARHEIGPGAWFSFLPASASIREKADSISRRSFLPRIPARHRVSRPSWVSRGDIRVPCSSTMSHFVCTNKDVSRLSPLLRRPVCLRLVSRYEWSLPRGSYSDEI